MDDFGDANVEELVIHFTPALQEAGAELNKIVDEWTALKAQVYGQPGWLQYIQIVTWPELNRKYAAEYPNIFLLLDLVLTLPASTAECERGFNMMKQIKSDWRSNLGLEQINELMTVQLLSPDIKDFDPVKAIDLWVTSGLRRRRPDYMDAKAAMDTDDSDDAETLCVRLEDVRDVDLTDNDKQ